MSGRSGDELSSFSSPCLVSHSFPEHDSAIAIITVVAGVQQRIIVTEISGGRRKRDRVTRSSGDELSSFFTPYLVS